MELFIGSLTLYEDAQPGKPEVAITALPLQACQTQPIVRFTLSQTLLM
jgi:hypothetical protein